MTKDDATRLLLLSWVLLAGLAVVLAVGLAVLRSAGDDARWVGCEDSYEAICD